MPRVAEGGFQDWIWRILSKVGIRHREGKVEIGAVLITRTAIIHEVPQVDRHAPRARAGPCSVENIPIIELVVSAIKLCLKNESIVVHRVAQATNSHLWFALSIQRHLWGARGVVSIVQVASTRESLVGQKHGNGILVARERRTLRNVRIEVQS